MVEQPSLDRMGEFSSLSVQVRWTSLTYQPSLPIVPDRWGVTAGAVTSMFTAGAVNVALLPAASLTTTLVVRLTPGPAITSGLALLVVATPEVASTVVNGMFTAPLFQPDALGNGDNVPNSSCGGVA